MWWLFVRDERKGDLPRPRFIKPSKACSSRSLNERARYPQNANEAKEEAEDKDIGATAVTARFVGPLNS
jgi:hypothetical protein